MGDQPPGFPLSPSGGPVPQTGNHPQAHHAQTWAGGAPRADSTKSFRAEGFKGIAGGKYPVPCVLMLWHLVEACVLTGLLVLVFYGLPSVLP